MLLGTCPLIEAGYRASSQTYLYNLYNSMWPLQSVTDFIHEQNYTLASSCRYYWGYARIPIWYKRDLCTVVILIHLIIHALAHNTLTLSISYIELYINIQILYVGSVRQQHTTRSILSWEKWLEVMTGLSVGQLILGCITCYWGPPVSATSYMCCIFAYQQPHIKLLYDRGTNDDLWKAKHLLSILKWWGGLD